MGLLLKGISYWQINYIRSDATCINIDQLLQRAAICVIIFDLHDIFNSVCRGAACIYLRAWFQNRGVIVLLQETTLIILNTVKKVWHPEETKRLKSGGRCVCDLAMIRNIKRCTWTWYGEWMKSLDLSFLGFPSLFVLLLDLVLLSPSN